MRKKFVLFLNISLICLSLCSIVFGAYSLNRAGLSLNSQLGYTSRNCETFIEMVITGAEKRTNDGNPTGENQTLTYKKAVAVGESTLTLTEKNFGKLYFLSANSSITVNITLINLTNSQKIYTLATPILNLGFSCNKTTSTTVTANANSEAQISNLILSTTNSNFASTSSGLVLNFTFS